MRYSIDRAVRRSRRSRRSRSSTRAARGAAACVLVLAQALALGGCSPKPPPEEERASLTERERDSTLGASGLPGASAVTKALAVSDTAAARAGAALPETP